MSVKKLESTHKGVSSQLFDNLRTLQKRLGLEDGIYRDISGTDVGMKLSTLIIQIDDFSDEEISRKAALQSVNYVKEDIEILRKGAQQLLQACEDADALVQKCERIINNSL